MDRFSLLLFTAPISNCSTCLQVFKPPNACPYPPSRDLSLTFTERSRSIKGSPLQVSTTILPPALSLDQKEVSLVSAKPSNHALPLVPSHIFWKFPLYLPALFPITFTHMGICSNLPNLFFYKKNKILASHVSSKEGTSSLQSQDF